MFPRDVVHFAGSSAYAQKIALLCVSKCTIPWTLPCKHLKNTVTDRMTPSLETGSQTWPTMSTRYLAKKRLLDVKPKDCKWLLYVVVAYSSMVSISFYKWIIAPPNEIEKQNHTQIIGEIHFYLLGITVLLYIYIYIDIYVVMAVDLNSFICKWPFFAVSPR